MSRLFYKSHRIKAITLDVTGTLLRHRFPIAATYSESAKWALLEDAPSEEEMHVAFKKAYKETLLAYPYFRHPSHQWWREMLLRTMKFTGRSYSQKDFDRFYLRVYQHFGSREAYEVFPDVAPFLDLVRGKVVLGIISNCPKRTVEQTLPMMDFHKQFHFFLCAEAFGAQKPDASIFAEAEAQVKFWNHAKHSDDEPVQPHEILHIGDSAEADFHGARAAGLRAALLDRTDKVVYNEWLVAPSYAGADDDEMGMQFCTYDGFRGVMMDMTVE